MCHSTIMPSSPVHASGQAAILKHTKIALNTTFTTAPAMATLNENLLQRDVFDYDFNRERIFLEIADAEIAAMKKTEEEDKAAAAVEQDDSDDDLARQSAKLSLSSSNGLQDGTSSKPRSTSEEDVAAAISASLREY
ncbi:hypothetical protein BBO99_00007540 [Phytophthora kernoviae]|uniref:Uncharacterized protein n=2 Tax=Phytophthora kernoviae TaxID=325452 RepID=A0A421F197_9STRA|nr:hypothetical protein G195_010338 [Phytophthora kernoviae 00238/432]KAG2518288.1 hypothetical protein JM16_007324 [Phytophthora kernoviae]KAG2520510.1 hypothetical protein JM18_007018 [Phytophthora kernoviae]RLN14678.1 hypothetical protein BBI17_007469 [Phytophthora kernoviae]RLN76463.1 hypothetical protein BBO99_00007540 [Phytophthora kernoviae]